MRGSQGVSWFRLSHQIVVCGEVDLGEMVEPHRSLARGVLILIRLGAVLAAALQFRLVSVSASLRGVDPSVS